MLNLKELHVLPSLEKDNGEYSYPAEYVGNVYKFKKSVIYFQEKKYLDFPLTVIEALTSELVNQQELREIAELLELTESSLTKSVENLEIQTDNITALLEPISASITELNERLLKLEKNHETLQSIEGISNAMDEKLQQVHKNFQIVAENVIKEKMEDYVDVLKKTSNKLKPATVMLYKEMGMDIREIMDLAKEGLL